MKKIRLDDFLVAKGLVQDKKIAQSFIIQGLVHNKNQRLEKPGMSVSLKDEIYLKTKKDHNYVSRGALKLKAAIEHFGIDVKDKVCIDVGCSTGGFTEILLNNQAKKVYAIDVGYGEMHTKLRNNPKVILLERTNARYLDDKLIPEFVDIVVCDASFISLKAVLPAAIMLMKDQGLLVALIKPQFEAKIEEIGDGGIIKDSEVHQRICQDIKNWLENINNFTVFGIIDSPILGMKGNKEFLIFAGKNG